MPNEDLNQEQEVDETTPDTGSESEELDDIFEDDEESKEETSKDEEIAQLKETVENLKKGFDKAFSEKGRKEKDVDEKGEIKVKDESGISPVLKSLYLKSNPEAQEVWEDVEREAKALGRDPFELYESSTYFKGEAKAKAEARKVEENSKSKISKPSSKTGFSKNLVNIKEEEIGNLSREERLEWLKLQAEKESHSID